MKNLIKAVFFDLDNTLDDALACHHEASVAAFAHFGLDYNQAKELSREIDIFGRRIIDVMRIRKEALGVSEEILPVADIMRVREPIFMSLAEKGIALLPGAVEALRLSKETTGLVAIVSSGTPEYIDLFLDRFSLRDLIDFIVDASDVQNGKPAPDCYNKAFEMLPSEAGIRRGECLVVEDAVNGVVAAKAAGMKVVLVPSRPNQDTNSKPDWEISSLQEFRAELFSENKVCS